MFLHKINDLNYHQPRDVVRFGYIYNSKVSMIICDYGKNVWWLLYC